MKEESEAGSREALSLDLMHSLMHSSQNVGRSVRWVIGLVIYSFIGLVAFCQWIEDYPSELEYKCMRFGVQEKVNFKWSEYEGVRYSFFF